MVSTQLGGSQIGTIDFAKVKNCFGRLWIGEKLAKKVTNEEAEQLLLAFDWGDNDDEKYQEFKEYYGGTLLMVFHKYAGWSTGISEKGYQNVMNAYDELVSLEYPKEITKKEIAYIVSLFKNGIPD